MAITFTQERKKQKYLMFALILTVLAILLIIWWGFFLRKTSQSFEQPASTFTPAKIEIDWQTLKDPSLQALKSWEEIPSLEEETGRENPFIPY